ncbi:hypothetical protein CRYUN_Cryun06bG0152000 [Craigia yunnanensis]
MNFHGGLYYVKRISYDDHTVHVADVNLANGSCSLPYRSLSMDEVQTDARYPGLVNYNYSYTLNYVRRSNNTSDLANSRVRCLSGNMSHVYVHITWYTLYDIPKSCKESGFQMRWSVECRDCRAKGRGCVYKTRDTTFLFKYYYAEIRLIYTIFAALCLTDSSSFHWLYLLSFSTNTCPRERRLCQGKNFRLSSPRLQKGTIILIYLPCQTTSKTKIGQGCFGTVYKGQLPGGCSVVKMLGDSKDSVLRDLNMLVYLYMPNGSLDKYIFTKGGNSHSFSWEKLHEIALGTAGGVGFLHGRSDAWIIHLDIKSQNILLDENFIPKISDFCLSKLHPKKHDFMSSYATSETIGYMAPELISTDFGAVSSKSDVYSFGMVLLELASGRRNVDLEAINSSKVHFPSWVYELNERRFRA